MLKRKIRLVATSGLSTRKGNVQIPGPRNASFEGLAKGLRKPRDMQETNLKTLFAPNVKGHEGSVMLTPY